MDISLDKISSIIDNNNQIKSRRSSIRTIDKKEETNQMNKKKTISEKELELSSILDMGQMYENKNSNSSSLLMNNPFNTDTDKINKSPQRKKLTKEDLPFIPIPIFSCIYCSNEHISFNHLSKEIISDKYLYQTSIFDMKELDLLISRKFDLDNNPNDILLNIVINNFEYINSYNKINNSKNYLESKNFTKDCASYKINIKKYLNNKVKDIVCRRKKNFYFKEIKNINKITKNSTNNKGLFNSSNSLINNLTGFLANCRGNGHQIFNERANNAINDQTSSYLNSISLNKNEIGLIVKDNNMHYMDNIMEKIDTESENTMEKKDEILNFLGEKNLKRKISKKDIEWEDEYYNIYNPKIDDDILFNNDVLEKSKTRQNRSAFQTISNKHSYINSQNKINYNMNSKNQNKSKSLGSTNNSSNIILKNSLRDKENKFLSLNKIVNIQGNNSTIHNKNCNINIQNKLSSLAKMRSKNKNNKNNDKQIVHSFANTRIVDRFKNDGIMKNTRKININLKNMHNKILFNYTANLKKEALNNNLNLKIKNLMYNSKEFNLTKNNKFITKSNHYLISLNKGNNNFDDNYFKTSFNKTLRDGKENKNIIKYKFNSAFKNQKQNVEYSPFRPKRSEHFHINLITNNYHINQNDKDKNINIKDIIINNNNNLVSFDKKNGKIGKINAHSTKKLNILITQKLFFRHINKDNIFDKNKSAKNEKIILKSFKNK